MLLAVSGEEINRYPDEFSFVPGNDTNKIA
jgi:hypothetical protein